MNKNDENQNSEPPLMRETITLVNPYIPNGSTALVLGGSNSGKTTLLVEALKNILRMHKKRYDLIIIFTESISSIPLQEVPESPVILLFAKFLPQVVTLLLRINQATKCRYAILIILDDVTELKNPSIDKLILVARNYGISTIINTQKITGISPSARGSIHNTYILGGRNPETRDQLIAKYLRGYIKDLGIKGADEMDKWLRDNTKLDENKRKLIKINGINDLMTVHEIARD